MIQKTRKEVLVRYVNRHTRYNIFNFIKWIVLAVITGLVVGGARVFLQNVLYGHLHTELLIQ